MTWTSYTDLFASAYCFCMKSSAGSTTKPHRPRALSLCLSVCLSVFLCASHFVLDFVLVACQISSSPMPTTGPHIIPHLLFLFATGVDRTFVQASPTCLDSTWSSCVSVDVRLPADFCCPSGTNCMSLDSSSTAYCCPWDSDCNLLDPISCDLTIQGPSGVMTTRLNDSLSTCGKHNCCPFGYQAVSATNRFGCQLDIIEETSFNLTGENSAAASSASTTSQSASASFSPNTTSLPTGSAATTLANVNHDYDNYNGFSGEDDGDGDGDYDYMPNGIVAGISVACTAVGLVGAILVATLCRRCRRRQRQSTRIEDNLITELACKDTGHVPALNERENRDEAYL